MPSIGLVVLAAGASTRMGSPKQLLPYRNGNLLNNAISVAVGSSCRPIVVVLGANAAALKDQAVHPSVHICINESWADGMISSIRAGIHDIVALDPSIQACIFTTCDQPFVTADTIEKLVEKYIQEKAPVVACEYAGTLGVPTLFDFAIFAELLQVPTALGAKAVLAKHAETARVHFPDGAIDIDTPDDYEKIKASQGFT